MEFKSRSCPGMSVGIKVEGEELVVPNQALSLRQILDRFTRQQALPIGKDGNYDEGEDDLEKLRHMDLVDKEEYIDRLKQTQIKYGKQEEARKRREYDEAQKKVYEQAARDLAEKEKLADPAKKAE